MSGIDYTGLVSNQTLLANFEGAVKQGIAEEAGSSVSANDIDLILSQGSLIVDFTVRVLSDADPGALASTLAASHVADTVAGLLKQSKTADLASTGDILVTFTGITGVIGPTSAPMPAPINASVDSPGIGHIVVQRGSNSSKCLPDSGSGGLTCCSAFTRTTSRPGCRSNLSWADGKVACKEEGMDLCTKASINYVGKSTDCAELDGVDMWTSEECTLPRPTVPPEPAHPVMRWVWSGAGPAPAAAPPGGWVYVAPHEHKQRVEEPEDTAFSYYQFEPLQVRGKGHVVEIAELVITNNHHKIDTSMAIVSTPSSLAHPGFSMETSLLVDGNISSVWGDDALEPITVQLPGPASADGFGFVTGNGSSDYEPVKWKFRGSFDGVRWTTLHAQEADDYMPDAKSLELRSFVFGNIQVGSPAAADPNYINPSEVAGSAADAAGAAGAHATEAVSAATASEQAASTPSESLFNETWPPADDEVVAEVVAESASAARQAVVESAEHKFEETAGEAQRRRDEEGSPDAPLIATLSTLGGFLLLAAGCAVAYYMLARHGAAAPPSESDPLLPTAAGGEDSD